MDPKASSFSPLTTNRTHTNAPESHQSFRCPIRNVNYNRPRTCRNTLEPLQFVVLQAQQTRNAWLARIQSSGPSAGPDLSRIGFGTASYLRWLIGQCCPSSIVDKLFGRDGGGTTTAGNWSCTSPLEKRMSASTRTCVYRCDIDRFQAS